jgi:hypothetical protein
MISALIVQCMILIILGNIMRNKSGVDIGTAPTLSLGKSYPSGKSMKDACGAFIGKVSQDNEPRFKR